jgi:hypothetical protein
MHWRGCPSGRVRPRPVHRLGPTDVSFFHSWTFLYSRSLQLSCVVRTQRSWPLHHPRRNGHNPPSTHLLCLAAKPHPALRRPQSHTTPHPIHDVQGVHLCNLTTSLIAAMACKAPPPPWRQQEEVADCYSQRPLKPEFVGYDNPSPS